MIPGIVAAPLFAATQGLVATVSPSRVVRTEGTHSNSPQTLTTPPCTVSVSGGSPPYTHSWSSGTSAPTAPTSATTSFSATVYPDNEVSERLTDTVTDANGVVATVSVGIYIDLVNVT